MLKVKYFALNGVRVASIEKAAFKFRLDGVRSWRLELEGAIPEAMLGQTQALFMDAGDYWYSGACMPDSQTSIIGIGQPVRMPKHDEWPLNTWK